MKKILLLLLVSTGLLRAQQNTEFRAVWITNVDSYVLFSDKNIADAMDFLAERGFNVIFPVVWNKGYTLYPSRIMDSLFQAPIISNFAGRDPLKKIILEAHRVGIEVVPWFEFGFASSYSANGGHIVQRFPSWAGKNKDGALLVKNGFDWLAGTNPQVQDFMIALTTEVLDNYDVDGVQGDDRLPAMPVEGGYDSTTQAIYRMENGGANPPVNYFDAGWKRWRANKLNNFYRRLKDSVKVRGDHYLISAAPSVYPWGYDNYLQDSKTWVDSGIVENFIPQLYRYDYPSYANELNNAYNLIPADKKHIFFSGMLAKAGSYVIPPSYLIQAMNLNRNKGLKGECFFFYEGLTANNNENGDTLKSLYYSQPAKLPYRNGNVFRPKAELIDEGDSVNTAKSGTWQRVPVQGYRPSIYWTNDTGDAYFDYYFDAPAAAWYDIYTYIVPNFSFSQFAKYTLYSEQGNTEIVINQQASANNGWTKIGEAFVSPGRKKVLRVDNSLLEPGKYIHADASMMMINRKKSPDVVITSINEAEGAPAEFTPDDFTISNAYPNPFNPVTGIDLLVSKSSIVSASLYNILGEEVFRIMDNKLMESGTHKLKIDAGTLNSGIYILSVTGNGIKKSQKVMLLK